MKFIYRYVSPGNVSDGELWAYEYDMSAEIAAARPGSDHSFLVFDSIEYDTDPLTVALSRAIPRVNAEAGIARSRYRTLIPGQTEVDQTKREEALALRAVVQGGGTPVVADYPMLWAEAVATGVTLGSLATSVLQEASVWKQKSIAIEVIRRKSLVAVRAATTPAEIAAVFPIVWP